jgi:dihydrofolate reductase
MRKVVVGAMVSLDGVMQAPGRPEEDPTGGFQFGGWVAGYYDEAAGQAIGESFAEPFDLLLGRRTYDIFAAYWPHVRLDPSAVTFRQIADRFNSVTKYVATHRPESLGWANSEPLRGDVAAAVRELKKGNGPVLLTQGSTELLHILFEHDLVDELRLFIFPVVLGKGKRLFGDGTTPSGFRLIKSSTSPNGVLIAHYEGAGDVKTGSMATDEPSPAELERRRTWR